MAWPHRRSPPAANRAAIAAAVLLILACLSPASGEAATSADTIRRFYDALVGTMREGSSLGAQGRYARLAPVIEQNFDLPYMTRMAVGPSWGRLSKDKQQEATSAFAREIAATYASRFAHYSGQQLQVTGEQKRDAGAVVDSQIVRADGSVVPIRYLMREEEDGWRVADIYLSGTISELATRRSEFASVLRRDGIDGLIAALNRKTDALMREAER
jgi:phospholipid transport system substrate-binding protein